MGEPGAAREPEGFESESGAPGLGGEFGTKEWLRTALRDRVQSLGLAKGRILGALAVLVVLAAGGYFLLRPEPAPPVVPRALPMPPPELIEVPEAGEEMGEEMFVHAAGAVRNPGVYRFADEARVVDLLFAAGGSAPNADLARVNLASLLSDGSQVFFPFVGEEPPPLAAGGGTEGESETSGPVDINTAAAAALQNLPGVGPVIAAAIEEHRANHGPYDSVDALLDVTGIGPAKLDQLRPHVSVGP